ncbi:MAG: hypothetical protein K2X81_03450 [Candidatus Obscuribacterales bacterium]|jgi:hypothetical protein|nr:hypothetical protein [Candidatus Obscuribacterales bacterium]
MTNSGTTKWFYPIIIFATLFHTLSGTSAFSQVTEWTEAYGNGIRQLRSNCPAEAERNLSRALSSLGNSDKTLYEKALTLDGLCSVYRLEDKTHALEASLKKLIVLCRKHVELDQFLPQALKTYSALMEAENREVESQWLLRQGKILGSIVGDKRLVQRQWYRNHVLSTIQSHIDIKSTQKQFQILLLIDVNGFPKKVEILDGDKIAKPTIETIGLQTAILNLRFLPLPLNLSEPIIDPEIMALKTGAIPQQLASPSNEVDPEPIAAIVFDLKASPQNQKHLAPSPKTVAASEECTKYRTLESEILVLNQIIADAKYGIPDRTSEIPKITDEQMKEIAYLESATEREAKLKELFANILFALTKGKMLNQQEFIASYARYRKSLYRQYIEFRKLTTDLNALKDNPAKAKQDILETYWWWNDAVKQADVHKASLDQHIGTKTADALVSWLLLTGVYKTLPYSYRRDYFPMGLD